MRHEKKPIWSRDGALRPLLDPGTGGAARHWRELKPDAEQIWLELGCGKGRFTAETAAQNPNVLYLAVERVPDA